MDKLQLTEAAEVFGVEPKYLDIWGKEHSASEEVLRAILASLGVDGDSAQALELAIEQRQNVKCKAPVARTVVISQPEGVLEIFLTGNLPDANAEISIDFEDGTQCSRSLPIENHEVEGPRIRLGSDLPLGYHRLRLAIPGLPECTARVIVAPDRAYQPDWLKDGRGAGIAVSLYGLRSGRNWGCGDCTDLCALIDWASDELRVSFVALNPLHAIPNRQPYNTSPYLPNSSFYRNHIYLDLEAIQDFPANGHDRELESEIRDLRDSEFVEYERVSDLKLRYLRTLFENFLANDHRPKTTRGQDFDAYVEREGELLDLFAVHSALDEAMHKANADAWNFAVWPDRFKNPKSDETREFARQNWRNVMFHKYIQWQIEIQFAQAQRHAKKRGLRIGLYHDLALATDRFGADVWAHSAFYASGCRVGSPPDAFSPKGQDWGFPPPNSERHFEDGYRLFAESIRKASANGGALRIDHVMRFFRLFWIPDGMTAMQGTYVGDRYQDLIRVLALESVRGEFIVVGEDLGTVPGFIRETLRKFGILSYCLFFFERDPEGGFYRPDEYPGQSLVSASTHDLPTLAGFWQNADVEARRVAGVLPDEKSYQEALAERAGEKQKILNLLHELRLLPGWYPQDASQVSELTGELHNAIIGFLALTPSKLLLVNQEDLFKECDQQNLPGTTAEHPNWRRKMKYTLEELRSDSTRGYTRMLRNWLDRTARIN